MIGRTHPEAKKDPRSAVFLAIALTAIVAIEAVYLQGFWKRNQDLRQTNSQLESSNSQMQRHIAELRLATQRIGAIFARLSDGMLSVAGIEGRLPIPGHSPKGISPYTESKVAKSLRECGFLVSAFQEGRRESSVTFKVSSNQLELHRLIPLLAEQENSNAFLFVDKLNLVRPGQTPAFSMNPVGLETELLIRVLSGPK